MKVNLDRVIKTWIFIANADDYFSPEEKGFLENKFVEFGIEKADLEKYFNEKLEFNDLNLADDISELEKQLILSIGISIALVDGEYSDKEKITLRKIAEKLNFKEDRLKKLFDRVFYIYDNS